MAAMEANCCCLVKSSLAMLVRAMLVAILDAIDAGGMVVELGLELGFEPGRR